MEWPVILVESRRMDSFPTRSAANYRTERVGASAQKRRCQPPTGDWHRPSNHFGFTAWAWRLFDAFDLDALGLHRFGFRERDDQHAVLERRIDALGVGFCRQLNDATEFA